MVGASTDPLQRFLSLDDPRRIPLPDILQEVHARYGGPLLITETSDAANQRADWSRILTRDAQAARARGVDLQGVCFFPSVTCPDWADPTAFFDGGIFDAIPQPDGSLRHPETEHVLIVVLGQARVQLGDQVVTISEGESVVVPAGSITRFATS